MKQNNLRHSYISTKTDLAQGCYKSTNFIGGKNHGFNRWKREWNGYAGNAYG